VQWLRVYACERLEMEKGARKALAKDPVVINNPTRAGLSCLGAHAIFIYIYIY
jgi:hypothetical protein